MTGAAQTPGGARVSAPADLPSGGSPPAAADWAHHCRPSPPPGQHAMPCHATLAIRAVNNLPTYPARRLGCQFVGGTRPEARPGTPPGHSASPVGSGSTRRDPFQHFGSLLDVPHAWPQLCCFSILWTSLSSSSLVLSACASLSSPFPFVLIRIMDEATKAQHAVNSAPVSDLASCYQKWAEQDMERNRFVQVRRRPLPRAHAHTHTAHSPRPTPALTAYRCCCRESTATTMRFAA